MAPTSNIWEVVGGSKQGGIIARAGGESSAPQLKQRLANGALVEEVEYDAKTGRIRFELINGDGPQSGWATVRLHGKDLLVKASEEKAMAAAVEMAKTSDEKAMLLYSNQLSLQRAQADVLALQEVDMNAKCLPPSPYVVEVKRMRPMLPKRVTNKRKEHTAVIQAPALANADVLSSKATPPVRQASRQEVPLQVSSSLLRFNKEVPITPQSSPALDTMFPWWSKERTDADFARDLQPAQGEIVHSRLLVLVTH